MGKRARNAPKRHQSQGMGICPSCGRPWTSPSSTGVPIAKLIESHAELCKALRLGGREMLQFVDANSQSLVRIRNVLTAAESVRKELKSAYELTDGETGQKRKPPQAAKARSRSKTSSIAEQSAEPPNRPTRNSKSKHLTRPNSYRILDFPVRVALEE